jgi:hypothetical protein
MGDEKVKVRVRFKDEDTLPEGERMWARPVRAHDGGGTFELLNTSFYVPLAARDVVRAEVDGDGMLQVTDVVCPGPFVMSWAVCRSPDEAGAIGDGWLERGASWSEGTNGVLATVWSEGVDQGRVEEVLAADLSTGRLIEALVIDPDHRVGSAQRSIEFALDDEQHVPDVTTSYWAPDDPYWRERGLDEPDFLAHVQTLAGEEQLIADALESGDHEAAREMMAFINGGPLW